jgi:hypothetical protein
VTEPSPSNKGASVSHHSTDVEKTRMQWEYVVKVIETEQAWLKNDKLDAPRFSEYLNEMGSDGWELVSCVVGGLNNVAWFAVLKRPK